jgi:hypothetical protein
MLYQSVGDFPVDVVMNQFDLLDWNYDDDSDLSSFIIPDESIDLINLEERSEGSPHRINFSVCLSVCLSINLS